MQIISYLSGDERILSLYENRFRTVFHLLRTEYVTSVLDFGCGDGKFLHYLAQEPFFSRLGGVDISQPRLARAKRRIGDDSRIFLYLQSFLEKNPEFSFYTAIVVMEVIEHLEKDDLHLLFRNLFGIAPPLIIVTSPNREYNDHYPILYNGLRHSSHKFEFTSDEFRRFAEELTPMGSSYTFTVGFCDPEHASQFILWKKV